MLYPRQGLSSGICEVISWQRRTTLHDARSVIQYTTKQLSYLGKRDTKPAWQRVYRTAPSKLFVGRYLISLSARASASRVITCLPSAAEEQPRVKLVFIRIGVDGWMDEMIKFLGSLGLTCLYLNVHFNLSNWADEHVY